jgi:hypothetical protein
VTCLKCRPDEAIDPSLSPPTHSRTTQRRRKKGQEITAQDRERRPMTFNRTGWNCIGTRGGGLEIPTCLLSLNDQSIEVWSRKGSRVVVPDFGGGWFVELFGL